ncbi:hypothetical protein [Microbacterium sp. SSM24]|uniref:hypothetical protein n=1 Tax=Microbacterium sp. SSM24 TaxID=2991714 RepID=UPI00222600DF|nr:hypothetical protein [Microbacterium sp. SSM24]MCW3493586.1 hypothetical protein [Microbacterium sp. SSM24]
METWQIGTVAIGLAIARLGALLRWRALWLARRVYRTTYWRGSTVDEVAKILRIMGWTVVGVGLLHAVLATFGIQLPSLR